MRLIGTRKRRANALIEMAFVMIPLTYIAFGTVEFGYFFYIKHSVQGAAREGCRAAIVPSATATDVQTAVVGSLFAAGLIPTNSYASMTSKNYTLTISPVVTSTAPTPITVSVSNTWGTVGIRASGLIGAAKTVTGTSVMRKEG